MKNHSLLINLIIFFLVLFFFVIPPAFFPSKAVETISFPIINLVLFLFSIFLFCFTSRKEKDFKTPKKNKGRFYKLILNAGLCFASLFALGMIFNFHKKKQESVFQKQKKNFFTLHYPFYFLHFTRKFYTDFTFQNKLKLFFMEQKSASQFF